jgi:uncharacterized repeat protein (TIGR04052 family)
MLRPMKRRLSLWFGGFLSLTFSLAVACENEGPQEGGAGGQGGFGGSSSSGPLTLRFRGQIGDEAFACGKTYDGLGVTSVSVTPQDFRFYVANVRLLTTDGKEVPVSLTERPKFQGGGVALLDFEDGSGECKNGNADLNDRVVGDVPPGAYAGIAFEMAVPEELNHKAPTTLPEPLQAGGMSWGWLFGFKFIRIELEDTEEPGSFLFHLGAVGCDNRPAAEGGAGGMGGNGSELNLNRPPTISCSRQNRTEIRLSGFDPTEDVIVADVAALTKGSDLRNVVGCHPNGEGCAPAFESVGLAYETGAQLKEQTFFRVEAANGP